MKVFMSYWELIWWRERYCLALTAQLARKKNRLDSISFPGKTSRTLSGKVQVTRSWCGNWRLSEGSYVNRYSAFIPKACGSCQNNPCCPPTTIHSQCPVDRETEGFFAEAAPLGMMHVCVWVCACVRQGLSLLWWQGLKHCKWWGLILGRGRDKVYLLILHQTKKWSFSFAFSPWMSK